MKVRNGSGVSGQDLKGPGDFLGSSCIDDKLGSWARINNFCNSIVHFHRLHDRESSSSAVAKA